MADVVPGSLLVASPATLDPNFSRTVVLVLEHAPGGSLGLVLNRPTDVAVAETLPRWSEEMSEPAVLFYGGPVEPQAAICLGRSRAGGDPPAFDGWHHVAARVGTVDLDGEPGAAGEHLDAMRLFAGYAGWAPGQLEGEIAAGGWFVVPSGDGDAFTAAAKDLWGDVLRRQPGSLAWVASFPADPALN
ncbi:MAG: YqgE/AlgH family protein [Acidimicrobiia bacterium]|nr:YqgE/AlgH family protein [Acidimicrobiia bacterium]